jgi:DNA invertase Pin-like site-specific DNA recombinase
MAAMSLEEQQRAFLDYCERSGLEVGPTYSETTPASSAEFRRMLRELGGERRGFTTVLVATLAVLGPTVRDQARRYLQIEALGLSLRIADGTEPDVALLNAWATRDARERRRDQVREGMRDRALRGEVLGRAPYGYRVVERHLRIEPNEAKVVREIFRRYLDEGEGVRVIARRLNEEGVRTRRGGAWSMVSVRGVLRNPLYIGTYRRLGVVVATEHESLVTRGRFYAVQERLAARRTGGGPQQRGEYLLSGLATCGYCGNRLIGVRRTRKARGDDAPVVYTYYQCESRTNQSRCDYHTRRTDELEAIVRERLDDGPPEGDTGSGPSEAPSEEAARLETRRQGLRRRLDTLFERRVRGEWTAARLRQEAAGIALEDLQAEERIEAIAERRRAMQDDTKRASALATDRRRLVSEWDSLPFEERRALLREVVAGIVVTDEDVRVDFAR